MTKSLDTVLSNISSEETILKNVQKLQRVKGMVCGGEDLEIKELID